MKLYIEKKPNHVVANVLDSNIRVTEFEFQLCNYVFFLTNTFRKGMCPLIPPAIG